MGGKRIILTEAAAGGRNRRAGEERGGVVRCVGDGRHVVERRAGNGGGIVVARVPPVVVVAPGEIAGLVEDETVRVGRERERIGEILLLVGGLGVEQHLERIVRPGVDVAVLPARVDDAETAVAFERKAVLRPCAGVAPVDDGEIGRGGPAVPGGVEALEEHVVHGAGGAEVRPGRRRRGVRQVGADVADAVVEEDEAVPDVVVRGVEVGEAGRLCPLPCEADAVRVRHDTGNGLIERGFVEDGFGPVVPAARFERVARANVCGAIDVRCRGRDEGVASIDGIAAGGFRARHADDGGGDHRVRHGQRRCAVEEAALVDHAVPGELLLREDLLVVAVEMDGADELSVVARVAAEAVAVVALAGHGGVLVESVAGRRDRRAAEERRRLFRPVQDGRHVAEIVAGNERMVGRVSGLRLPVEFACRFVHGEGEVVFLDRHEVGGIVCLAGSRGGDERLDRVVGARVDARDETAAGGAPFAVAREREAVRRPGTEVFPADGIEARRCAAVGPAAARLLVADPDVVVRAGGTEVLPRRRRRGVIRRGADVADAVVVPDGTGDVAVHVEVPVVGIIPVLDAGAGGGSEGDGKRKCAKCGEFSDVHGLFLGGCELPPLGCHPFYAGKNGNKRTIQTTKNGTIQQKSLANGCRFQ